MTTRRNTRPRPVFRTIAAAALAACVAAAPHANAQERLLRLPREVFDVIPPEERVSGERGQMAVWQVGCRSGPTEWARRRIVDIAAQEWAHFGFQTIDSTRVAARYLPEGLVAEALNPEVTPHIATAYDRLGVGEGSGRVAAAIAGYWSATPDGGRILVGQNRAWTGPGRNAVGWLQPWSAAFVSWVMCEAGLGDPAQFERDISHRVYVDQAIRARDGLAPEASFVAYDTGEEAIVPGDLICNGRGTVNYRSLADRRPDIGMYAPTHCDIVVKVDEEAMRILAVGGNVEQSVSLTVLPATRDAGRQLRPIDDSIVYGARTIFAHLKLRAPPIEANALENTPIIRALNDPAQRAALTPADD